MMFVYLDIVGKFSCQQCGKCCRNNWLVTVDEAGYRRNKELFASMGQENEFYQSFIPLQAEADYGEYARIAKLPEGGCCFLTPRNLCRLQQAAGHGHLDTVCQWFPRYPMDTERGIEFSLSFSCPAAVRLALGEEPLRILRSEQSPIAMTPTEFVTHVYPSQRTGNSAMHYYFEIESHLVDLLQARAVPLPNRLAVVRRFIGRLAGLSDPETMGRDIQELCLANYDRLDAAESPAGNVSGGPGQWLIENYFVNYIFRKSLYGYGFAKTLRQLDVMQDRLAKHLREPGSSAGDPVEVSDIIVRLELEFNHNSRKAAIEEAGADHESSFAK